MIKRTLVSVMACLVIVFGASLAAASEAYAGTLSARTFLTTGMAPIEMRSIYFAAATTAEQDLLKELQTDVLPQLTAILTPQQLGTFETDISGGDSFRKTFKALMLTPEQKREIKTVLSSIPQKDAFASLTPGQKKLLFLKKKEAFMPSSEEIIDKINAGKAGEGGTVSKAVQDKIEEGIKARDESMPSSKSIMDKIEAGIESFKAGLGK